MIITVKRVGICIGILAILYSISTLINNLILNEKIAYIQIALGIFSGIILFLLCKTDAK